MLPEPPVLRVPIALTIAGSDPSGGAGIQADLKTFSALGVYGAAAITALTAQNTRAVTAVANLDPCFVAAQIEAVLDDLHVDAIKVGMLSQVAIVEAVAEVLSRWPAIPVVLDPVMVSKSGAVLLSPDAVAAVRKLLLPRAALITPNIPEAAVLLDESEETVRQDLRLASQRLIDLGARATLLKGGHAGRENPAYRTLSDDLLFDKATQEWLTLSAPRLATSNTHGTGCTLSAAIAAGLAHGSPLAQAVADAKQYLHAAIAAGATLSIVRQNSSEVREFSEQPARHGPVHHFFAWWPPPRSV